MRPLPTGCACWTRRQKPTSTSVDTICTILPGTPRRFTPIFRFLGVWNGIICLRFTINVSVLSAVHRQIRPDQCPLRRTVWRPAGARDRGRRPQIRTLGRKQTYSAAAERSHTERYQLWQHQARHNNAYRSDEPYPNLAPVVSRGTIAGISFSQPQAAEI